MYGFGDQIVDAAYEYAKDAAVGYAVDKGKSIYNRWSAPRAGKYKTSKFRRGYYDKPVLYTMPYSRKRARITSSQRGTMRTGGYYNPPGPFNQELKFLDLDVDDAIVASTGTIQAAGSINNIAQGTGSSDRIGRKVVIKKLQYNYIISLPEAATTPGLQKCADILRLIIYQDKQCNGATAAVLDILASANFQSFRSLENVNRFRILVDHSEEINAQAAGGDGTAMDNGEVLRSRSIYRELNMPVEFNSTTGAITEIRSNNIGILMISANGQVGVLGKIRLRFKG